MEQIEFFVKSSLDGTLQPSLFFPSTEKGKRPLLVGLHTWSFDRFNQIKKMLPVAERNGFHLLLPDFRGKNRVDNPELKKAMGSLYAKTDIREAIDYALEHWEVDRDNIFLLGLSGGGHMALLMAGFCPEYFKAIGAAVPITDLEKWTTQNLKYARHVRACCGTDSEDMWSRSPMAYLDVASRANLKLFHGKWDPVVPMSQSIAYYSAMLEKYPEAKVYLDIFDGGHQIDMKAAEHWLLTQYKKEKMSDVTG